MGHRPHHPECGNIGRVAPGGRPRADREADVKKHLAEPAWFVGKFCKLGFPTPKGDKEYMWVKVEVLQGKELIGSLHNTPVFAEFAHGDGVGFTTDEIIDVAD